jgi:hypothetical protein
MPLLFAEGVFFSPHLWKSHERQEWRGFSKKNAPRGTLLWNGNPQDLVYVENFFIKNAGEVEVFPL